jgi:hypothetical protein
VSWPATQFLIAGVGWRGAYLIYAAVLAFLAAPLLAFALPRSRATPSQQREVGVQTSGAVLPARGLPFLLLAGAFAAYAFVPSGLSAHLLAIFGRAGMDPATVVAIGALFGPSQVLARLGELVFAGRAHPLSVARFAVGMVLFACALFALFGISVAPAAAFMVIFGMANGLLTIARGAVPLALFGAAAYGHNMGRIGRAFLVMQAIAPFALAFAAERSSDAGVLVIVAGFALLSLLALIGIQRPPANLELTMPPADLPAGNHGRRKL